MIDTVKFQVAGYHGGERPDGEKWQLKEGVSLGEEGPQYWRCVQHRDSGLRMFGGNETYDNVESSLPKALHGFNGVLLANEEDVRAAFDSLAAIAGEACSGFRLRDCTRADLVWHFQADPLVWMQMHQLLAVKGIRDGATRYPNHGLVWKGSKLQLRMYDKNLELFKRPGRVVRVEWECKQQALRKAVTGGKGKMPVKVEHLGFARSYQTYRKLCLGIQPARMTTPGNLAEFLAARDALGARDEQGRLASEAYLAMLAPRSRSRLVSQLRTAHVRSMRVRYDELLPEDGPPEAIDVLPEGIRRIA